MSQDTVIHRLFHQGRYRPYAPAYYEKREGRWQETRWGEYVANVRRAARALLALGFEPGNSVCILGFNRPEWVTMDLATMAAGGAPAGIYTTCSPQEVQYIVHHAEAPVVLVENEAQWNKIASVLDQLPLLRHVVLMRDCPKIAHEKVLTWEEFLAKGDGVGEEKLDERVAALEPTGLATLIYTSGTTGPPKGVMLSHRNLAWTARTTGDLIATTGDDRLLSYLPLSHIAEQVLSVHGPVTAGYAIYFAESIEKVADNLKEVRPTVFFGVPRIWEKMHAGVASKLKDAEGAKKKMVDGAQWVSRRVYEYKNSSRAVPVPLMLAYQAATKAVYTKLKAAIGLDRARVCVSGAAPIGADVLEFFSGFDLMIYEVYGQSEDTGPTSLNVPGRARIGTVGPAIPGVSVRIADDGEILVKGPNVFLGYYKEPAATADCLRDGWLHSGDLGAFDADGFLKITGRKKEILITSGGKNITPKNIEAAIKEHSLVGEAVLIGDRRKYLTALVALEPEATKKFCDARGIDVATAHTSSVLRDELQAHIEKVNSTLARVETVKKFTILSRPLTIEHGELTPTLKVKRRKVYENFSAEIEAMYAGDSD